MVVLEDLAAYEDQKIVDESCVHTHSKPSFFTHDFHSTAKPNEATDTLQSAFLKFKKKRQNKLQSLSSINCDIPKELRSREETDVLRAKFVQQASCYFGVPYAKRYHKPGTLEYEAPLFLDCCGLVRKVVNDLKDDFGFTIGPWNQAYMFDTLPNVVRNVNDMKPGDLVFVSGIFYDSRKKKQKHDIVHVEIWAGSGKKTIGARWKTGKVELHDSYEYTSKTYYNMVYHFKSIDTWLQGVCKSFCPQHPWKIPNVVPRNSIFFSLEDENMQADEIFATNNDPRSLSDDVPPLNIHTRDKESFQKDQKHLGIFEEKLTFNDVSNWSSQISELNFEFLPSHSVPYTLMWKRNINKRSLDCSKSEHIKCRPAYAQQENIHLSRSGNLDFTSPALHNGEDCNSWLVNDCFCEQCTAVIWNASYEMIIDYRSDEIVEMYPQDNDFLERQCIKPSDFNIVVSENETNTIKDGLCFSLSCPNPQRNVTRNSRKLVVATESKKRKDDSTRNYNPDHKGENANQTSKPFCTPSKSRIRVHEKSKTFFIGGQNGSKIVDATLSSFGWVRIYDNRDTTFYMKWVECKKHIDFTRFREGEQMVNHIPNGSLLTTKTGLLTSLQDFERLNGKIPPGHIGAHLAMKDFVPETFKLQNQTEIENFIFNIYKDGEMWICKPAGMNQGKGIFLVRTREELIEKLQCKTVNNSRQRYLPTAGRVIQRYIVNPFLLNGFKADIRVYMLIAGTCPYMVFYYPGYVRLSLVPYSLNEEEIHAHLTNQYIQKKHPLYAQVKEETIWSLQQLQEYMSRNNIPVPPDWVATALTKRMKDIMLYCFQSVRFKLQSRLGYFDLLGFDFMMDENLNVWLIEVNVNPALHTNCKILSSFVPELVEDTLKLVIEVFEKSRRNKKITSVENLGKFQLIFNEGEK